MLMALHKSPRVVCIYPFRQKTSMAAFRALSISNSLGRPRECASEPFLEQDETVFTFVISNGFPKTIIVEIMNYGLALVHRR